MLNQYYLKYWIIPDKIFRANNEKNINKMKNIFPNNLFLIKYHK